MRSLAELNPEWGATAEPGHFFLMFDCQTSPCERVYVQFHRGPPQPGVWQCTSRWRVTPGLEHLGEQPDLDCLTLVPSIGDHAHDRTNRRCPGHVTITNGQVE